MTPADTPDQRGEALVFALVLTYTARPAVPLSAP
jgi:hypothetical protein